MTVTPPHGFDDDAASRRLLRSRPPPVALAWVARRTGVAVDGARALRGGTSSAVHALRMEDGRVFVLRRYVRGDGDPDSAGREARLLELVARIDVPTPEVVAVDPDGSDAGTPTVLMSHLPGHLDWFPADVDRWLARMAELLPPVHELRVPPGGVRPFAPYPPTGDGAPPWARRPRVWSRAVEISRSPAPEGPHVLVHRDFHPGNVLWRRGRVTGLVDWQAASVGPAVVDVGHCRANLLRYGIDVADRFTVAWEGVSGATYHPWADVVSIVGFLDLLRDDPPSHRLVVEEVLSRAVADLG